MTFDHEELDALDKIKWAEKSWYIVLIVLGLGLGVLALWVGIQNNNYYFIIPGIFVILFVLFMAWPDSKNKNKNL